jgi:hypothetical protein
VYIQIAGAIYNHETDDFICKVASTVEDAKALIEAGYEYVCDFNAKKLFRKRQ